jgi:hypothetical protein
VPYERADNVLRQGRRAFPAFPTSVLAQAPQFPFLREICQAWDVPKAPAAQRAVTRGSISTLIIAGSYDAITSPQATQAAAKPLSRATLVIIPGVGHFVVPKSDCAARDGVIPRRPGGARHRLRRRGQAAAVHHRAAIVGDDHGRRPAPCASLRPPAVGAEQAHVERDG